MIFIYNLDREIGRVRLENGKLVVTRSEESAVERLIESMRRFDGHTLDDVELYASLPFRLKGRIWAGYEKESKEAQEFEARLMAGRTWRD